MDIAPLGHGEMAKLVDKDDKAETDGDQGDAQHALQPELAEQGHQRYGQQAHQDSLVQAPRIAAGFLIERRRRIAHPVTVAVGRIRCQMIVLFGRFRVGQRSTSWRAHRSAASNSPSAGRAS